jgi:hypothetical protein
MWDRINKVPVQVILAVLISIGSFGLLYLLAFKEVPNGNRDLFNVLIGTVLGSTLTPVIGWLYTSNKVKTPDNTKP